MGGKYQTRLSIFKIEKPKLWKIKTVLKETIDHSQQTEVNVIDIGDRDLQNKPAIKSLNTAIG